MWNLQIVLFVFVIYTFSPNRAQISFSSPTLYSGRQDSSTSSKVKFQDSQTEGAFEKGFTKYESCKTASGEEGKCQPRVKCALYYNEYFGREKPVVNLCQLDSTSNGLCCPIITKNRELDETGLLQRKLMHIKLSARVGLSVESRINSSVRRVEENRVQEKSNEDRLLRANVIVRLGSSSHGHLLFFQTSKRAIEISKFGYNLLQSSRDVALRLGITNKESGEGLQEYNLKKSNLRAECPLTPTCSFESMNYRTIDGSCNNLKKAALGMSFTPLYRILTPHYADGIWTPRVAQDLTSLPSARLLSSAFIPDRDAPDSRFSLFVMQFGQFVDHDLSHVPIYRYTNGSGIECCTEFGSFLSPELTHPFCFPIEIPVNDPFYSIYGQRCMNFVRSMVGPRVDCSLGYGDQLSQTTHWLDSSNVYGSTKEESGELRLYRNGKLRGGPLLGAHGQFPKGMLPIQENEVDECTNPEEGTHCFNAGDLRVNEMIGLTATHLIWFREHNRLAAQLKLINSFWNDDQIFYEARRILNAEYQHILYNEWLPSLIGRDFMQIYGILPLSYGFATDYNSHIDPSVSNAFAAAAFRMGHSLIQGILNLVNEFGLVDEQLQIHRHFNKPFRIRESGLLDKLIRTLTNQPIQSFDPFITSEVTLRLFQPSNRTFGMDLISLNIQRARDHGVPGYNFYREVCKLGRAKTFAELVDRIPLQIVGVLSRFYRTVDDVDLFIGGISEIAIPGALLGPTFTCIIGDQFARSKKGDRFAYDLGGFSHSFTPYQLEQIRGTSFARILCDNGDNIQKLQPLAFFLPNLNFNPILACDSKFIPRLDISYWKYTQH